MVKVKTHHFSGTPGGSARFDSSGSAVANFQKAHQARRSSSARKLFAFAPDAGEVGSYARTIFEYTGFAHPQVHNTAIVYQIIIYA